MAARRVVQTIDNCDCPKIKNARAQTVNAGNVAIRERSGSARAAETTKSCKICKMYLVLCCYHAKRCRTDNCKVVNCMRIRESTANQADTALFPGRDRKRKVSLKKEDVDEEVHNDNYDPKTVKPKGARRYAVLPFTIKVILNLDEETSTLDNNS
ncbi:hypothetical protein PRIPAC_94353 [Pristionchus pacificus]|uniref:Uncharacterized protein n=1 Tax=Pristionchus pacificus TaxID=54126 RepID=A0A2A6BB99_PRIPA|nr:hypothetical protein PRIPAC_94353 [Pristionchus pacificus]|eukprot:PDM63134.1 hypothetical protein PRIPAC_50349 [Pristionchus pacificus]